MTNLETSIEIAASPKEVWKVLMDHQNYGNWNPFILKLEGEPKVGSQIKALIQPDGKKPMEFTPTVLNADENKEFRWLGHLFVKGLFDGEHYFILQSTDSGTTKFIHGEKFTGILVKPLIKMIGESTVTGFKKMNEALKKQVERKPVLKS